MSKEVMDVLVPVVGEELARDIIAHRKGLKCPLTPRGARSLVREYQATGDAVNAAEEHLNRGWQGFKAEWVRKPHAFTERNNPTPRQSANYGQPEVPRIEVISPEERERRAAMVARLREEGVLRGVH